MLETFYPGEYADSAYQIDFDQLYREGYRGVIFDIDNTLVPHGAAADARAKRLFAHLKKLGYRCCLLSNNKEPRVRMFNESFQEYMIFVEHNPGTPGYQNALKLMHTDARNTLFVGDQIFTDIWGANRAGIRTVLVKPIHPKEEIQIILKRYPEKLVLHFYRKWLKKNQKASPVSGSLENRNDKS